MFVLAVCVVAGAFASVAVFAAVSAFFGSEYSATSLCPEFMIGKTSSISFERLSIIACISSTDFLATMAFLISPNCFSIA